MDYWGDSLPGSRKCECGILGQCEMPDKWCNCDSGLDTWLADAGYLTESEYLPVRQLRIGDTGSVTDQKQARYTLGPLVCTGDGKLVLFALQVREIVFQPCSLKSVIEYYARTVFVIELFQFELKCCYEQYLFVTHL